MIQSTFVYFISILFMLSLAIKYRSYGYERIKLGHFTVVIFILYYVLLCGLRFDVGVDYMTYFSEYSAVKYYMSHESYQFEPGWSWFTWILSRNDVHFTIYFSIIAFVQIFFLVGAFRDYPKLFPYMVLALFLGGYFIGFQNVIRQNIVMCVFLFLVMRKQDASFFRYVLVALACSFIHKSSIIMVLCYLVIRYFKFNIDRKVILCGLFLLCVLVGYKIDLFTIVTSNIGVLQFISGTSYDVYLHGDNLAMGTDKTMGIGYFLRVLVDLMLIYSGGKAYKTLGDNSGYPIWFRLFYLGTCLHYLFPTSRVLGRPILYLTFFTIPVLASYFYFLVCRVKRFPLLSIGHVFTFVVLFLLFVINHIISPVGNMAEYHFWWEYY